MIDISKTAEYLALLERVKHLESKLKDIDFLKLELAKCQSAVSAK
jgi:hypothetical protein